MRTQVGIIGAGPAGLLLSQLLHLNGISSIVLEKRTRDYVEARIRAGVLESGTVDLIRQAQVADRMDKQKLVHDGIEVTFNGQYRHINFRELVGKPVTVWGQTQIVRDLIAARIDAGGEVYFEAEGMDIQDIETDTPSLSFTKDGERHEIECDFIAGCDGFYGISRKAFPEGALKIYDRTYPFGWLGILAEAPPVSDELIYARHERGYALFSMRSPTLSRLYIQSQPDEDLNDWPDERIYQELKIRGGEKVAAKLQEAPSIEKSVSPMRSFVVEPMRHGRLFLAGDAAHIVPPTGAKGLNLAAADIRILHKALIEFYRSGSEDLLDAYSATCLRRIWNAQRFSWWMTSMLHIFPDASPYERQLQVSELDYVTTSRAASTALAENYVGLPFD